MTHSLTAEQAIARSEECDETMHTSKGRKYCGDCGNPDCPNVDPEPFFKECPGSIQQQDPAPGSSASLGWTTHQSTCRFPETPCECID